MVISYMRPPPDEPCSYLMSLTPAGARRVPNVVKPQRFACGTSLGVRRLPAALAAPLLVELADAGKLLGGEVAVDGADVVLELLDGAGARDDAVDARLLQEPAQRRLSQRLPLADQESELLDALESK